MIPEIHIYDNEGGRSGIDHQPGRQPAQPEYRDLEAERPRVGA